MLLQLMKTVIDSIPGRLPSLFMCVCVFLDSPSRLIKRENDPIQKCENCGKYGYLSEFCKSGRFCSQACVGAYAGK